MILSLILVTAVLGATIKGVKICNIEYDCGVDDAVCPTYYASSGDICNICDPQCGPCDLDCNISGATITPTETPILAHDEVILKTTTVGSCPKDIQSFTIEVSAPSGCNINPLHASDIEKIAGTDTIEGTWYIDYINSSCAGKTVTASSALDAATITYTDGTVVQAGASGSFTFGNEGEDRCRTECTTNPVCYSTLRGIVTKEEGGNLEGATITLQSIENNENSKTYAYQGFTNTEGKYEIEGIVSCNEKINYQFIASEYYRSPVISEVKFKNKDLKTRSFSMELSQSSCQPDCTREGYSVCDRTCNGWKGCIFASQETMNYCDPTEDPYDGYPKGSTRQIGSNELVCCTGALLSPATKYKPQIYVDAENIIKSSRVVIIGGEQLNMHLIVFD